MIYQTIIFLIKFNKDKNKSQKRMWKNQKLPHIVINEESNNKNINLYSPVSTSLTQKILSQSQHTVDNRCQSQLKQSLSSRSNVGKLEQIQQLEDTQNLRLQLFRLNKTIQSIEQQSDRFSSRIGQFRSNHTLTSNQNILNIQQINNNDSKTSHKQVNKQNTGKDYKFNRHSHQSNNRDIQPIKYILANVDLFLRQINSLCSQFMRSEDRINSQQIKHEQQKRSNAKKYKKILQACNEKLFSAEQLLNTTVNRLAQKDNQLKACKQSIANYQKQLKTHTQISQKNNKLLQSDSMTYKQVINNKNRQIQQLLAKERQFIQKQDQLYTELQRIQNKAKWFESMYEDTRLRLTQSQAINIAAIDDCNKLQNEIRQKQKKQHKKCNQFEQQIQKLSGQNKSYLNMIEVLKSDNSRLESDLNYYSVSMQNYKVGVQNVNKKNSELQGQIIRYIDELKQKQQQIQLIQQLKQLQKQKVMHLQDSLADMELDINTILEELKNKQIQICRLRNQNKQHNAKQNKQHNGNYKGPHFQYFSKQYNQADGHHNDRNHDYGKNNAVPIDNDSRTAVIPAFFGFDDYQVDQQSLQVEQQSQAAQQSQTGGQYDNSAEQIHAITHNAQATLVNNSNNSNNNKNSNSINSSNNKNSINSNNSKNNECTEYNHKGSVPKFNLLNFKSQFMHNKTDKYNINMYSKKVYQDHNYLRGDTKYC